MLGGKRMAALLAAMKPALPNAYRELEYIESTGTQYIDTGYAPKSNSIIVLDSEFMSPNPGSNEYGRQGKYGGGQRVSVYVTNSFVEFGIGNYYEHYTPNALNKRHEYKLDIGRLEAYYDGAMIHKFSSFTQGNGDAFFLFARNVSLGTAGGYANAKNYKFIVYEGNELKLRMIPCMRLSDRKPGMYDTVSKTFFTNAGTGEFVMGPFKLPAGLKQVEYISGGGEQYLNTGFYPTSNSKVELNLKVIRTRNQAFMGQRFEISSWLLAIANNNILYWWGDPRLTIGEINDGFDMAFKATATSVTLNGVTMETSAGSIKNLPILLAKVGDSSTDARFYAFSAFDGNDIRRYMIPVKNINTNEYLMYDLVERHQYHNAGSGAFTGGDVL